jgi:DNA repair photolyase
MSPVLSSHSSPIPMGFPTRRRHVRQPSVGLFPMDPEHSPNTRAGEPAPLAGPGSSMPVAAAADCPPSAPSVLGHTDRGPVRHRDVAASATTGAQAPLVGIAHLAALSPPAESRRSSAARPEYFLLPVRSLLNKCDSRRVPFDWTINPYRGCEFGCQYCYARYTHEYMDLDGADFERKIFVKRDAAVLLARDMARKYSYHSAASGGQAPEHIAMGTATDPYQPAEREYGVTRACLQELSRHPGLRLSIITKSNQIVRDIDILRQIAACSMLHITLTVTTLRPRLARLLEPRAPRPDLRLAAIRDLHEAGLSVGVLASPVLPWITDREGELEAVAAAARDSGADWFNSGVLFLMPSSARTFLPFLNEKFPRFMKQYERWFARDAYAPEEYRRKIAERVARIRAQYGLAARPREDPQRSVVQSQLSLEWDPGAIANSGRCASRKILV